MNEVNENQAQESEKGGNPFDWNALAGIITATGNLGLGIANTVIMAENGNPSGATNSPLPIDSGSNSGSDSGSGSTNAPVITYDNKNNSGSETTPVAKDNTLLYMGGAFAFLIIVLGFIALKQK